jgi:lambda family phage portal protein
MAEGLTFKTTAFDRALFALAPQWALSRVRARAAAVQLARHFEAASSGGRTSGWRRSLADANTAAAPALATLRAHSRDLVRNNGWAKNGKRVIGRNVVGYGITPKLVGPPTFIAAFKEWAGSTQCDAAGRLTFSGLQKLSATTIFEAGEVLVRRRWRRPEDELALPFTIQVLEPDFLDTAKHNVRGQEGGRVVYGVEFDAIGRRVAYWLYPEHPGNGTTASWTSKRVPASDVIHSYDIERAGQDRGLPWLSAAIAKLKNFDEFEDAQLMKQAVAACLAVFETDANDAGLPDLGTPDAKDPGVARIEPATITRLPAGRDVTVVNPPTVTDDGFTVRTMRSIAAAIGVTYEDLTGDYSQVNFSSARMSRIAHWLNVWDWQFNMLIPQLCDPIVQWAVEAALYAGLLRDGEKARASEWTPMPMPMTDPDKEARANAIRVRTGQASYQQIAREQGSDFAEIVRELGEGNAMLDAVGVHLDTDPRRVSQAGVTQARPAGTGFNDDAKEPEETPAANGGGNGAAQGEEAE